MKIYSVRITKQAREHLRGMKRYISDEEAAEVVRRIFRLTVEGKGPYQIAQILQGDMPYD